MIVKHLDQELREKTPRFQCISNKNLTALSSAEKNASTEMTLSCGSHFQPFNLWHPAVNQPLEFSRVRRRPVAMDGQVRWRVLSQSRSPCFMTRLPLGIGENSMELDNLKNPRRLFQ